MEIVSLSSASYPKLVSIWEASVRATHGFVDEAYLSVIKEMLAPQFFPSLALYGAVTQGSVVGFIGLAGKMIEMLFIDPHYRGQGIGRKLVAHAVAHFEAEEVDVNEQNEQALGFYEHLGFVIVGRSELDGLGKPYPLLHLRLVK